MKAIAIVVIFVSGCSAAGVKPYPWNFPPKEEWNAPLEASWLNLVDNYRNLTAKNGTVWNPVVGQYEPNLGQELQSLGRADERQ